METAEPSVNQTLADISKSLRAYQPEKIILIGSWARHQADPYSDIDFIIIKKTQKPFIQRLEDVVPYIQYPGKTVQAFVYTPEEFERMRQTQNPFVTHALKESKILYEKPS